MGVNFMSRKKNLKKQSASNENLARKYFGIIKHTPVLIQPEYYTSSLKQPSLLEEVDSITTYEVSATIQDWK